MTATKEEALALKRAIWKLMEDHPKLLRFNGFHMPNSDIEKHYCYLLDAVNSYVRQFKNETSQPLT